MKLSAISFILKWLSTLKKKHIRMRRTVQQRQDSKETTLCKVYNLLFYQRFIDRSNIFQIAREGLNAIAEGRIDVLSLDLDGNDIYFAEELLGKGVLPSLFIVEYNAKFMPPIRWSMPYEASHRWGGDDYFGASLCTFDDLFRAHGYFLACCNPASGSNAFFVHGSHRHAFQDVPSEIEKLWSPPRYFHYKFGHRVSARTVSSIMNGIGARRSGHQE